MVTRTDILKRRNEIIRIADHYGAHDVRLFGSVARAESSPASDVDVLVRMDSNRSLLDRIALIHELEDLLHCKVDVVNDRALDPLIRENVLAEAVPL
jgi:predicted nucleotidyltransferase